MFEHERRPRCDLLESLGTRGPIGPDRSPHPPQSHNPPTNAPEDSTHQHAILLLVVVVVPIWFVVILVVIVIAIAIVGFRAYNEPDVWTTRRSVSLSFLRRRVAKLRGMEYSRVAVRRRVSTLRILQRTTGRRWWHWHWRRRRRRTRGTRDGRRRDG